MPAQLKEVRNRIGAVKSTQQITKAMKLVAASKLRRAQDKVLQMRPYAAKLYEILGNISDGSDANIEFANARPIDKVLIVLLTSDKGLCGGFNTAAIRMARSLMTEKYAAQKAAGNVSLLCIGKKGRDFFRRDTDLTLIEGYVDLFTRLSFENGAVAAEQAMNGFLNKEYDVVEVCYHRFKNQVVQMPETEQFLPIQKIEPEEGAEASKTNADYIYEPSQEAILKELVPKILKTRFYRFILDNNASEHGSRMTAMDNATENAEELLRELKITYNRARQAAITTELTEIVSGAAALNG